MKSILVVEDDENLNRGIASVFDMGGYRIFTADTAAAAKQVPEQHGINLLFRNNPSIRRVSKIEAAFSLADAQTVMLALGGGTALIIAFVGILNFVNVILTDITVRKMEFATLESIGIEKRKVRWMLIFEGLGYAFITLLLTATLGNGFVFGIFSLFKSPTVRLRYRR